MEAQGSWECLTSAEYRDSFALGSLGDTVYLLGGQMMLKNQQLITNSVERWCKQGGPWRSAAPLPLPLAPRGLWLGVKQGLSQVAYGPKIQRSCQRKRPRLF